MADSINSLPTDKNAPTHPELQIVDYLFEKDGSQQKIGGLVSEFKMAIFASALFVILSLPPVDDDIPNYVNLAAVQLKIHGSLPT